jgi:hypothetical protein
MRCSSGLENYFNERLQVRSGVQEAAIGPVTALGTRPGRPTPTRRAGREATQHPSEADDQGLNTGTRT